MSRRSYLLSSQQVDLAQRRRTRDIPRFSEQPVPVNINRLPGAGEGSGGATPTLLISWLSPDIGWDDAGWSWLA